MPSGLNLAMKTSPEWPVSSITGACNPLVRGIEDIRVPSAAEPSTTATAFPLPRLGLLTIIWEDPKASDAGRFSDAMAEIWLTNAPCICGDILAGSKGGISDTNKPGTFSPSQFALSLY